MTQFFIIFTELSETTKERYLIESFQVISKMLKEMRNKKDFHELERIYGNLIKIYRDQELYELAQTITEEYIEVIKSYAIQILETEKSARGIERVLNLVNRILEISHAYLEDKKINLNDIYKIIAEIYIELGNLSEAHAINDLIDNKSINAEINREIERIESQRSAIEIKEAEEAHRRETLPERLSHIQMIARGEFISHYNQLRQRRAYRRAYFDAALKFLDSKDYEKAIEKYEESIHQLIKIKQYNLAGISLAVMAVIRLKQEKFNLVEPLLKKIKDTYPKLVRLLSETFSVILIEYLIDLNKIKKIFLMDYVNFFEILPLFKEEEIFIEKDKSKELREEIPISSIEMDNLKEKIVNLADKIQLEKSDIAKRKLMRDQYWRYALEDLSNKRYYVAAIDDYLNVIPQLMEKKFYKQTAVSLIIGCLLIIKGRDIKSAKSSFYENLSRLEKYKSPIEDLAELKLIKELFFAMENDLKEITKIILTTLIHKLALFDQESDYISSLLPEEVAPQQEIAISREELGKKTIDLLQREQNLANLKQNLPDIRREKEDVLKIRTALRRYYYKDIISALEDDNLKLAGDLYYDLAKSASEKNDYTTTSLLILLHGLALIKNKDPITNIKSSIDKFLNSLGLNKRAVEKTFYIKCINFILDVVINKLDKYIAPINEMLQVLPLFEEENKLKQIEL